MHCNRSGDLPVLVGALAEGCALRPRNLTDNLLDVAGACRLLAACSDIDADRIGVMSSSIGGMQTLLMMTRHNSECSPACSGGADCSLLSGRAYFDYDLVDENMVGWDLLRQYKILLHTSGKIFPNPP